MELSAVISCAAFALFCFSLGLQPKMLLFLLAKKWNSYFLFFSKTWLNLNSKASTNFSIGCYDKDVSEQRLLFISKTFALATSNQKISISFYQFINLCFFTSLNSCITEGAYIYHLIHSNE